MFIYYFWKSSNFMVSRYEIYIVDGYFQEDLLTFRNNREKMVTHMITKISNKHFQNAFLNPKTLRIYLHLQTLNQLARVFFKFIVLYSSFLFHSEYMFWSMYLYVKFFLPLYHIPIHRSDQCSVLAIKKGMFIKRIKYHASVNAQNIRYLHLCVHVHIFLNLSLNAYNYF